MGKRDTGLSNAPANDTEIAENRELAQPRAEEDSDSELEDNGPWGGYMPLAQNPADSEALFRSSNELGYLSRVVPTRFSLGQAEEFPLEDHGPVEAASQVCRGADVLEVVHADHVDYWAHHACWVLKNKTFSKPENLKNYQTQYQIAIIPTKADFQSLRIQKNG
ncbi:hypothetical protein HUJ04_011478 [Dendroctonus ponderosae]|nr:hypothetical protein HUJ04_011478 [Dendroctonus ponderosae]